LESLRGYFTINFWVDYSIHYCFPCSHSYHLMIDMFLARFSYYFLIKDWIMVNLLLLVDHSKLNLIIILKFT